MTFRLSITSALFAVASFSLPTHLAAQSVEDVKSDVLSALATPLPITVIGPLLTPDVVVTEEGDGFRATLQDTTLMGLFPVGEVSIKLVALDEDTYRVTDLQFPKELDFPGLANITFDGMTLDGTWSATDRSYANLKAELNGLRVVPGQGDQGAFALGQLAFDVAKEPDNTDTESRFEITLDNLSATGAGPDVSVGSGTILLSANGERPVDLYSLLREVIMVAGRQGGVGLQNLGESLLGNTYGTVDVQVSLGDINVKDPLTPNDRYFRAAGLQASLGMRDVTPRDWGMAELAVTLDEVKQHQLLDNGAFDVERALLRLNGTELPVADMFAAINRIGNSYQTQPILVTDLLDGFLEFGALELTTEGKALKIETTDSDFVNGELVHKTAFFAGYDDWNAQIALKDFNKNQGSFAALADLNGGVFTPGPDFNQDDLRHVNAWFPKTLKYGGQVGNLNEGFLKQLFKDVYIQDIEEPIEIILPLMLYASASAFDVAIDDNRYETGLFALSQSANYRVYPAKFMSMFPFEGEMTMRMTGFDGLVAYVDEIRRQEQAREYGDDEVFSMFKSVLTVMRNLGTQDGNGTVTWEIEKEDVDRSQVTINGTTLYYPELAQFLPLIALGSAF